MQPGWPALIATVGLLAIAGLAAIGLLIHLAGRVLRRPFWKWGRRLIYGALADLGVLAGLYLLTIASSFSMTGSDRIEAALVAGFGLLWIVLGSIGLRAAVRRPIPDAGWQRHDPASSDPTSR